MSTRRFSTQRATPAKGAARRFRRGVSLIEVVMASMLVAILTTAVVGAIVTVIAADVRNQQKLEALELGNRLLLQFLDDKDALPPEEEPIHQGLGDYRWTLTRTPVKIQMPASSIITRPMEGTPGDKTMAKTELLTVTVYSGKPDGLGGFEQGKLLCTLSRLNHPLSVIYRNPDTMSRAFSDPIKAMQIFTDLIATSDTASAPPPPRQGSGANGGAVAGTGGTRSSTTAGSRGDPNVRTDDGSTFSGARGGPK
jgi:type II secretory pathway pseudopilin PulG